MNDTDRDVVAITQLVNLYGLAVDSQRWELFDRIFATDVDADYGTTSHWTDREGFKTISRRSTLRSTPPSTYVHPRGPRRRGPAFSFCNGGWRLLRKAAGGEPLWDGTGWYDDTLCAPPAAGASPAGHAASPGGPAIRASTKRSPA